MSHSKIIQLSPVPVKPQDRLKPEDLYEDYKLAAVSDGIEELSEEEEKEALQYLAEVPTIKDNSFILNGILQFNEIEIVSKNYDRWFEDAVKQAESRKGKGRRSHACDMRNLFSDYKGDTNLYVLSFVNGLGNLCHSTALRSAELVAEMAESSERNKWYVGSILNSKDA